MASAAGAEMTPCPTCGRADSGGDWTIGADPRAVAHVDEQNDATLKAGGYAIPESPKTMLESSRIVWARDWDALLIGAALGAVFQVLLERVL